MLSGLITMNHWHNMMSRTKIPIYSWLQCCIDCDQTMIRLQVTDSRVRCSHKVHKGHSTTECGLCHTLLSHNNKCSLMWWDLQRSDCVKTSADWTRSDIWPWGPLTTVWQHWSAIPAAEIGQLVGSASIATRHQTILDELILLCTNMGHSETTKAVKVLSAQGAHIDLSCIVIVMVQQTEVQCPPRFILSDNIRNQTLKVTKTNHFWSNNITQIN